MDFREVKSLLNKDVRDLFTAKKEGAEPPAQARSQDGYLEVKTVVGVTEFICLANKARLFSAEGRLAGTLSVSHPTQEERTPSIRVTVPMENGGREGNVTASFRGHSLAADSPLLSATRVTGQDGSSRLQFTYDSAVFTFQVPPQFSIHDFEALEQKSPLFSTPPPVGQMAALLRATMKERRDAWSVLNDLAPAVGKQAHRKVDLIRSALGEKFVILTQPIHLLEEYLAEKGKSCNPQTLAAWCLLIDLEIDSIGDKQIEKVGAAGLGVSWEALSAVATIFSERLEGSDWKRFQKAGIEFLEPKHPRQADAALQRIRERLDSRDARSILQNLVRQSPSPRIEEIAAKWHSHPGPADIRLDGLDGLCALLEAAGRRINRNTVLALCLFVEIESGRIKLEKFEQALNGNLEFAVSAYTVEAVSGALEVNVLCLSLPPSEAARAELYQQLLALSPCGLLQGVPSGYRFLSADQVSSQAVDADLPPNGEVFFCPSMVDHVTETDLATFLRLGLELYACFQSDLDHRRAWKRVSPKSGAAAADGSEDSFSFVDGFRTYRFQNSIMGKVEYSSAAGPGPVIYKDTRGTLHYYAPQEAPKDDAAMTPVDLSLWLPTLGELPPMLYEEAVERQLGTDEKGGGDLRKLELIQQMFGTVLSRHDRAKRLSDNTALHKKIRKNMSAPSLMQVMGPLVDPRTLEGLLNEFDHGVGISFRLYEPVVRFLHLQPILDLVCLALVYELCTSDGVTLKAGFKNFNRSWFRSTLLTQVGSLAESAEDEIKAAGCRLLSACVSMADKRERLVMEYELNQLLESSNDDVAREAAAALIRLALEEVLKLPSLWVVRSALSGSASSAAESQGRVLGQLLGELQEFLSMASMALFGKPLAAEATAETASSLKGISSLLLAARLAVFEDNEEAAGRGDVFMIATRTALEGLVRGLLGALGQYADSLGKPAERLVEDAAALKGLWDFIRDHPQYASLVEPIRAEGVLGSWEAPRVLEPQPLWIHQGAEGHRQTSPFFQTLFAFTMESRITNVSICRIIGSDPHLAGIERLQVLQPSSSRFVNLLKLWSTATPSVLEDTERQLLARFCGNVAELSNADGEDVTLDTTDAAALEGLLTTLGKEAGPSLKQNVESQQLPQTLQLARRLLNSFQLPQDYLNQVLHIFVQAHH